MPQGIYIENPDNGTWRAKPQSDGSFNVNVSNPVTSVGVIGNVSVGNFPSTQAVSGSVAVSNLPGTQAVSGSVSVTNLPATQAVSGTVAVSNFPNSAPSASDIVRASRTTTGTLTTIPSGRVFYGSCEVSCSIAVVGNAVPSISDGSSTIVQCEAVGLALTTVANSTSLRDVYIAGPATITFTAGATGTSSGSIAGRLL